MEGNPTVRVSTKLSALLTLEDKCFLYLICHLEDFSPETLGLLPLHLRQKLLLNLPAADVKQLEHTGVVVGIDVDDTVWRVVFTEQRRCSYGFTPLGFTYFLTPFYDSASLELAKEILFSVRGCLGVANWEHIRHHFAFVRKESMGDLSCVTPWRYVAQVSEGFQYIDLLLFLVEKCHWFPAKLEIQCSHVVRSDLWIQRDKVADLVRKLLSGIQNLTLSVDHRELAPVATFLLEQALSNSNVSLTHLKLKDINSSDCVMAVAKFFSSASASHTDDPIYRHQTIPYSGLSSINIYYYSEGGCVQTYLESMIRYQNALKSVTIFFVIMQRLSSSLVSTLASLFHQPQFEELTLGGMELTWEHVSTLVTHFLTAPAEDHEKVLCLGSYHLGCLSPSEAVDVASACAGHSTDGVLRKGLVLRGGNRCIPVRSCTEHLSSLTIEPETSTLLPMRIYLDKPNTTLQHLRFSNSHLRSEYSLEKPFLNLFQGVQLMTVHLNKCFIGPDGLLPVLTEGLRQQVSMGSLEDLSLKNNDLGTSVADCELEDFFDVLFSLPQIPRLQLDLTGNHLSSDHFYEMWDSCRRHQPGKQLKLLNIAMQCRIRRHRSCCKSVAEHVLILRRIALGGDFIDYDSDDSDVSYDSDDFSESSDENSED